MTDPQLGKISPTIVAYLVKTQNRLKERVMSITSCVVRNFDYMRVVQYGVYAVLELFTGDPLPVSSAIDPTQSIYISNQSTMYRDLIFKIMRSAGISEELIPDIFGDLMNSIQEELKFTIEYLNRCMNQDGSISGFSFSYNPSSAMLVFQITRIQTGISQ